MKTGFVSLRPRTLIAGICLLAIIGMLTLGGRFLCATGKQHIADGMVCGIDVRHAGQ